MTWSEGRRAESCALASLLQATIPLKASDGLELMFRDVRGNRQVIAVTSR